jgi:LPXTG-site transpeptidase (sortase) family protein
VGYLEGSAYPTWKGNSALTAHIYRPDGQPGPFYALDKLTWGDIVVIHTGGQRYIYQVRGSQKVSPNDASILRHEEKPWLTLITCAGYNEKNSTYTKRLAVRAVLLRVESE